MEPFRAITLILFLGHFISSLGDGDLVQVRMKSQPLVLNILGSDLVAAHDSVDVV